MILAGDIGGTKTVLALYDMADGKLEQIATQRYNCDNYEHLQEMIKDFSRENGVGMDGVDCACFGVAGPVKNNRCVVTNLPWTVDGAELSEYFGFKQVKLLNDLEAIASAIPYLENDDLVVLNEGTPDSDGVIGVLAPGTGLGEAFLTKHGESYVAHPCEGGHTDFAANNDLEYALCRHLFDRFGHASYERVISGGGIANIYAFLRDEGHCVEPNELRLEIELEGDPAPVIQRHLQGDEALDICIETMRIFVEVLGAEAGNLGLKLLARGGIHMAGGIPPKILPLLREQRFMDSFLGKGRMSALVEEMPLYVVVRDDPGLLGAAMHAATTMRGGE